MSGDVFEILFGIVVVLVLIGRGIKTLMDQQEARNKDWEENSDSSWSNGWEPVPPASSRGQPAAPPPPPVPQPAAPRTIEPTNQPWSSPAPPQPVPPPVSQAAHRYQQQEAQAPPEPPSVERFIRKPQVNGVSGLGAAFTASPKIWGGRKAAPGRHIRVTLRGPEDLRRAIILREVLDRPRAFDL